MNTYAATNQNFNILARLKPVVSSLLLRKSVIGWGREGVVDVLGRGGWLGDVELCGRGGVRGEISVVVGVERVLWLFESVHLSLSFGLFVSSRLGVEGCVKVLTE